MTLIDASQLNATCLKCQNSILDLAIGHDATTHVGITHLIHPSCFDEKTQKCFNCQKQMVKPNMEPKSLAGRIGSYIECRQSAITSFFYTFLSIHVSVYIHHYYGVSPLLFWGVSSDFAVKFFPQLPSFPIMAACSVLYSYQYGSEDPSSDFLTYVVGAFGTNKLFFLTNTTVRQIALHLLKRKPHAV